ncbi:unnamed protein product [Allacma fusca]|uniref:EB domain-containing protein n=1 Tax=Allacma fusca TaxID=39272 RepID=A0A8J2KYD1_9HEXA|nr:unnamed protein product [Allacma fusca]
MKTIKVSVLTSLIINLSLIACHSSLRSYTKEYGESCNHLEKCNYRHWLKCHAGTCECADPDQMLFIQSNSKFFSFFSSRATLMDKKSCRARVSESCKREYFVDDENNSIVAPVLSKPQEWSIPKQTQLCVENAYCHPHGICRCNFNYALNTRDGSCLKFREFSEICDRDSQCHPDHFLKCRRGICQCDPLLKYDREKKKCSAGPGDKCVLSLNRRGKIIDNCVQNSTCHMGQCKCSRGYVTDMSIRLCSRDYGYFCSEDFPCVDNFKEEYICVNSTCICNQDPEPTEYDEKSQGCRRQGNRGSDSQRPSLWKLALAFLASFLL